MAPALTKQEAPVKAPQPTAILHRTPWRPPIAVSGEGVYLVLEDGRRVIDSVGGAAVSCIGNGHPEVKKAMKEQVDKLSCTLGYCSSGLLQLIIFIDVYNMQLSNEPAEELANYLISTSKGAFALCGFVSGGTCAL